MKCFVISIGGAVFALPEDTGICIQDILREAIPLRQSFKKEFYWAEHPGEKSLELQLIEEFSPIQEAVTDEAKTVADPDELLNALIRNRLDP